MAKRILKKDRMYSTWFQDFPHSHSNQDCGSGPKISFVVVQLQSHVRLFATPWTAAGQASLSSTISWSFLKFMPISLPNRLESPEISPHILGQLICNKDDNKERITFLTNGAVTN